MIMTNYWKIMKDAEEGSYISDVLATNGVGFSLIFSEYAGNNLRYNINMGAILSNSDAAVDEDDYTIDGNVSSNFTNVTVNASFSASGDGIKRIFTITGTNSSESAVEIKRVGLTKLLQGSGLGNGATVLLAVVDLAESITVGSLNSFSITLEWDEG